MQITFHTRIPLINGVNNNDIRMRNFETNVILMESDMLVCCWRQCIFHITFRTTSNFYLVRQVTTLNEIRMQIILYFPP
jgi:hypothetical protein